MFQPVPRGEAIADLRRAGSFTAVERGAAMTNSADERKILEAF
jgi:hypothetical protein